MSASIKLVSINIERSKHLDLVLPFLAGQNADVICLQELHETDIARCADTLHYEVVDYAPMTKEKLRIGEAIPHGICILSREEIARKETDYYVGVGGKTPDTDETDPATFSQENRAVMFADIKKDGEMFRIGTTHFTWSTRGQATDVQRNDMGRLLGILDVKGEFVLTGDFNAPRGGEIFAILAGKYKDSIPPQYKTSIDVDLHRAGKLRPEELTDKMVDGLFTTPEYIASNVQLHSGISDHMAITATISKT